MGEQELKELFRWLVEHKTEAARVRDTCCITDAISANRYNYHDGKAVAYAHCIVQVHYLLERMAQQEEGGG